MLCPPEARTLLRPIPGHSHHALHKARLILFPWQKRYTLVAAAKDCLASQWLALLLKLLNLLIIEMWNLKLLPHSKQHTSGIQSY